jgi:hypothetical protein
MQSFKFIVSDGPRIPDDPEVRTVIRKQAAMEGVAAARRKRGAYGSINSIQYRSHDFSTGALKGTVSKQSASLVSATSSRSTSTTHITASKGVVRFDHPTTSLALVEQHETWLPSLIANPISGYEALRAEYRFDIMDLCPMTGFHIGQSTMSAMVRDSALLGTVLGKQVDSYLSFVPSRYGHKPYLTAVVDSVIAKARGTLCTPNVGYSAVVTRTYGNALRAVQEAMDDEEASRDADLLCAVQMLSLHEVCWPHTLYRRHVTLTCSEDPGTRKNISICAPHPRLGQAHQISLVVKLYNLIRADTLLGPHRTGFLRSNLQGRAMLPRTAGVDETLCITGAGHT